MTNREKSQLRQELKRHLDQYRDYRGRATLVAARLQIVTDDVKCAIGFNAVRIAECLDRRGGRIT